MNKRSLLCLLLALPISPAAWGQGLFEQAVSEREEPAAKAQDSSESASETATVGGLGFELSGYLRGDLYLGKVQGKKATETKSGYGEAALKIQARKGQWGDALGELRLRSGVEGGQTDLVLDLREAYVNAYVGALDIRLGHQIVVWGRADGVNPTNNLTPRDMRVRSPNEDDMRLANLCLRTHLNLEPIRWEVVWVPFFAPSHFPNFELPEPIAMEEPDWPDANIKNGTLASRVHFLWPAFEASLSYLIGTATFPGVRLAAITPATGGGLSEIGVAFTTYRQQVVGGDFSTSACSFGLRGEVAYRRIFDYKDHEYTPLPDLQYVFGVDRELWGQVSVIAQYSGRTVFDWDFEPSFPDWPLLAQVFVAPQVVAKNRMVAGQLERFQHSATLRVEWKLLQETLRLELMGMVNFSTEELMLRPKIGYDITDALTVLAGGEIYSGPDETLFGMIETTYSAGYAELKASF
jgi:hypothetical protein